MAAGCALKQQARPNRRATPLHSTLNHGGGPSTNTVHLTMAAGHAPARHAEPWCAGGVSALSVRVAVLVPGPLPWLGVLCWCVAHRHGWAPVVVRGTSTACPTMKARRAQAHTNAPGGKPGNSRLRPTTTAGHAPEQHAGPWQPATHQTSTPDRGDWSQTSNALSTMKALHVQAQTPNQGGTPTPAQHARTWRRATNQHSTPDHGSRSRTRNARPQMKAGRTRLHGRASFVVARPAARVGGAVPVLRLLSSSVVLCGCCACHHGSMCCARVWPDAMAWCAVLVPGPSAWLAVLRQCAARLRGLSCVCSSVARHRRQARGGGAPPASIVPRAVLVRRPPSWLSVPWGCVARDSSGCWSRHHGRMCCTGAWPVTMAGASPAVLAG